MVLADAKAYTDGRPVPIHGTAVPTMPAGDGSTYFQHGDPDDPPPQLTHGVIAQWTRTGGVWVETPIRSEAIANLDVGKLTAGAAEIHDAVIQKLTAHQAFITYLNALDVLARRLIVRDADGQPVIQLTGDVDDALQLYAADGGVGVTANNRGEMALRRLSVADEVLVGGRPVNPNPPVEEGRLVAIGFTMSAGTSRTHPAGEFTRVLDVVVPRIDHHWYRVRAVLRTFGSGAVSRVGAKFTATASTSTPTPNSTTLGPRGEIPDSGEVSASTSDTCIIETVFHAGDLPAAQNRVLLSVWPNGGSLIITNQSYVTVETIGRPAATETIHPLDANPGASTGLYRQEDWQAAPWAASYRQNNAYYDWQTSTLFQGYVPSPATAGNTKSLIGFPSGFLSEFTSSKTDSITSIGIELQNLHTYSSAGHDLVIGLHNHTNQPSTYSKNGAATLTTTVHFQKGGKAIVWLTPQMVAEFKAGRAKGITLEGTGTYAYGYYQKSTVRPGYALMRRP